MPEQRNNAQWESFKDKNFWNLFDPFEAKPAAVGC